MRVWRYSNADKSWSFYDPRPAFADANTLTMAAGGNIVWVNVAADQTFQGQALTAGWNLIALSIGRWFQTKAIYEAAATSGGLVSL